jgi:hypothetical protein
MKSIFLMAMALLVGGCAHYDAVVIPATILYLDEGSDTVIVRIAGVGARRDPSCTSFLLEQRLLPGDSLKISAVHKQLRQLLADDYIAGLNVCLEKAGRRLVGIRVLTSTYSRDTVFVRCKVPWTDAQQPIFTSKGSREFMNQEGSCAGYTK